MQEKLLFIIPIYNQTESKFNEKWEGRLQKQIIELNVTDRGIKEQLRQLFLRKNPPIHKFNDICGYVEVVFDRGVHILNYYYLNGDRRKKYNKNIPYETNIRKIYPPFYHEAGTIWTFTNQGIKDAVIEALTEIRVTTSEWNCLVDLDYYTGLIENIDLVGFTK